METDLWVWVHPSRDSPRGSKEQRFPQPTLQSGQCLTDEATDAESCLRNAAGQLLEDACKSELDSKTWKSAFTVNTGNFTVNARRCQISASLPEVEGRERGVECQFQFIYRAGSTDTQPLEPRADSATSQGTTVADVSVSQDLSKERSW